MATVDVVSPRTIRARRILKDLSGEELRELARPGERTSEYGSPVYSTRVKNRSAKNTYVVANGVPIGIMQQPIERGRAEETIRQVQDALADMELIQVDRRMGMNPEVPIHCRLYVPREYARIAYMWHNMLFPSSSKAEPDFISVYVPDWKETLIFLDVNQGYTYILGTDYPGEAKKSMLRQAMYWIKRRGGLGLHAGSKILRVTGPDGDHLPLRPGVRLCASLRAGARSVCGRSRSARLSICCSRSGRRSAGTPVAVGCMETAAS